MTNVLRSFLGALLGMTFQLLGHVSALASGLYTYISILLGHYPRNDRATYKPRRVPEDLADIDDATKTIILPDGRTLSYATYGAPSGPVVFYLHGGGDGRIGGGIFDSAAYSLGIRIIAPDRPGIGWSSPNSGYTLQDHAQDIQQLAEHLGVFRYSVLGVSGGGIFALACAYYLPSDQLRSVAIVCGIAPYSLSVRASKWPAWLLIKGFRHCPVAMRWYADRTLKGLLVKSDADLHGIMKQQMEPSRWRPFSMSVKDQEIFRKDSFVSLGLRGTREYFAQGSCGFAEDGRLWATDLDFKLDKIRDDLPMHLWYGTQDDRLPPRVGKDLAAHLGRGARLTVVEEAHVSLVVNCGGAILASLLHDVAM